MSSSESTTLAKRRFDLFWGIYLEVESNCRKFQFGQGIIKKLRIVEIQSLPSTIPLSQDGRKRMPGRPFDDLAFPKLHHVLIVFQRHVLRLNFFGKTEKTKRFYPTLHWSSAKKTLAWNSSPIEAVSYILPWKLFQQGDQSRKFQLWSTKTFSWLSAEKLHPYGQWLWY